MVRTGTSRGKRLSFPDVSEYPSPAGLRKLRGLLKRRNDTYRKLLELDDELFVEIERVRREGVTVRMLADVLGISPSTVQEWTRRGRQLRSQ